MLIGGSHFQQFPTFSEFPIRQYSHDGKTRRGGLRFTVFRCPWTNKDIENFFSQTQHFLKMVLSIRKLQEQRNKQNVTREGFLRKIIVAVSFFQNCAIHQYS